MVIALVLAAGIGLGARPTAVALTALAVYFPMPTAGLVIILIWLTRTRPSTRAAAFCEAIAGELKSGDSLRNAVAFAAQQVQSPSIVKLCWAGAPIEHIARATRDDFEEIGPELEALLVRSAELGAPPSELFNEVGDVALAQTTVAQEAAAATAPVRATAVVMIGALGFALFIALGSGGLDRYLGSEPQLIAAGIGLTLTLVGSFVAVLILMRDR